MKSPLIQTAVRLIMPVLLAYSIVVLLRGHDQPGGGFIGGLIASTALALHAMVFRSAATRALIGVPEHRLVAAGLGLAIASGIPAWIMGYPFLTSWWTTLSVLGLPGVTIGTPLLFETGIFLVVVGVLLMMLLSLAEEKEPARWKQ